MTSPNEEPLPSGPISWMTRNRVAANLLMAVLIIGGLLMASQVKQEIFPEFTLDVVRVNVIYPGASPRDVEQGILLSIEDEVRGIVGVKKITSTAFEGRGIVSIELISGADVNKALQDVKSKVDSILSFPEDAERPVVSIAEAKRQVISLVIYGNQTETTLRDVAEVVRDELLQSEVITLVELDAVRPLLIAVEVPQSQLRAYALTLDGVADLVRRSALELPGGGVKAPSGEVLLRTQERRDFASEFRDISVVSSPEGTKVRLSDIAQIIDGFEDTDQEAFFEGLPAVRVDIFRAGDQKPLEIAEAVHKYVEKTKKELPPGIDVAVWNDRSEFYAGRIQLLLRNAAIGLLLVLCLLGLFLEPRLAFWVTIGIPTSIIGSFLLIPFIGDASINMVSLFAFIVTLGIIVDDAVVVGEIICQHREKGISYLRAAVMGAREISVPVTFAVLTNIAAFTPLFFVPGTVGKIFLQIPAVTITVFIISLVESLYVLPAHLSHRHEDNRFLQLLSLPRLKVAQGLNWLINYTYLPTLKLAISHRYATLAAGFGLLMVAFGTVIGGHLEFSFLPKVDSDLVTVQAYMPFGVPIDESRRLQARLVKAAKQVIAENGGPRISQGVYTQIGTPIPGGGPPRADVGGGGSHVIGVQVMLVPSDERDISGVGFAEKWRDIAGEIVGVETISFSATIGTTGGAPIDIQLSHRDTEILETAANELGEALREYAGVADIDTGVSKGKPQFSLKINPEGRSLGITASEMARQVRSSFYGAEAFRQQRGRNEVKVLVRLPEEERQSIYTIENLILRTPEGGEIPLPEAAKVEVGRSYTSIRRSEGRRVLRVTADVDDKVTNANRVIGDVVSTAMPTLLRKYPGLSYSLEGQQREQIESLEAIGIGFIFMLIVLYGMLAIPFKSYAQPIVVMMAIPFGFIGAVLGHILLGYELSIMSMFGIIALSGVVINDSLVLVVTTNRIRAKYNHKVSPARALQVAAAKRFRPIILTSLTTFGGLAPMIFETSLQARFLIPMAIALGFGILFATFIILLLIPALYLIVEDVKRFLGYPQEEDTGQEIEL